LHPKGIKAQRLKRVFNIDITVCAECGGPVKVTAPAHPCARGISASMHVIASIEDPEVIEKILAHIEKQNPQPVVSLLPEPRAPPIFCG
jgi:hypothetical protein